MVQRTAGSLWNGYKRLPQESEQLLKDMQQCKMHEDPFDSMPCDEELVTLKLNWTSIASANEGFQLSQLALLMLDIKPHAADPEKTVSLTTVKMHFQKVQDRCDKFAALLRIECLVYMSTRWFLEQTVSRWLHCQCRAAKPLKNVEDITLREQELAVDSEKEALVEQSAEAEALLMAVASPGDTNDLVEQRVVQQSILLMPWSCAPLQS